MHHSMAEGLSPYPSLASAWDIEGVEALPVSGDDSLVVPPIAALKRDLDDADMGGVEIKRLCIEVPVEAEVGIELIGVAWNTE